jgi:hypothetical protein
MQDKKNFLYHKKGTSACFWENNIVAGSFINPEKTFGAGAAFDCC